MYTSGQHATPRDAHEPGGINVDAKAGAQPAPTHRCHTEPPNVLLDFSQGAIRAYPADKLHVRPEEVGRQTPDQPGYRQGVPIERTSEQGALKGRLGAPCNAQNAVWKFIQAVAGGPRGRARRDGGIAPPVPIVEPACAAKAWSRNPSTSPAAAWRRARCSKLVKAVTPLTSLDAADRRRDCFFAFGEFTRRTIQARET